MAEFEESLAALERMLKAEPGPAVPPAPEQVETRVERIIAQVARGAYDEAARASEALLGEGVRDVRLVSPYLFGAFLAHGPQVLSALLSTLHQVFTRGWGKFGPVDNKTTQADSGLLWLFKSLHKHLEFHARTRGDVWRKWCESCSQPQLQEAIQRTSELGTALEQLLPGGEGVTQLLQLKGWLSENQELFLETGASPEQARAVEQEKEEVRRERGSVVEMRVEVMPPERKEEESPGESPEEPKDEASPADPKSEAPLEEPKSEEKAPPNEPTDEAPPGDPKSDEEAPPEVSSTPSVYSPPPPDLKHSPALEKLLHKLAAFDKLMERQEFSRASVVAKDVLHVIDHFDPLVYLPSLFCRFLSRLSAQGGSIEPLMQGTRSLSESALERLYRIDLEAFLNSASGAEDKP